MTSVMMPTKCQPLPPLLMYRFSPAQYERMRACGILCAEDPIDFSAGLIIVKGRSLAPAVAVASKVNGNGQGPVPVRRFTVEEYHRLLEEGILTEDDRVELLEGWIVEKMTRNPPHDVAVALALKTVGKKLTKKWHCRGQSAITSDTGEPEPDVAVVRGRERDYLENHPRPRDVGLLIEVADKTLSTVRDIKGPSYARVNSPCYWIVNLAEEIVEVYSDPTGPDPEPCYRKRENFRPGDKVPLTLDGKVIGRIAVNDLLP